MNITTDLLSNPNAATVAVLKVTQNVVWLRKLIGDTDTTTLTTKTPLVALYKKGNDMLKNLDRREYKKVLSITNSGNLTLLDSNEREKIRLIIPHTILKMPGDDDLLDELEELSEGENDLALDLAISIMASLDPVRKRQVNAKKLRRDRKLVDTQAQRDRARESALESATAAKNTILDGIWNQCRFIGSSEVESLGPPKDTQDVPKLIPQDQLKLAVHECQAADHILRLCETPQLQTGMKPALTMAQSISRDLLAITRETNLSTFKSIARTVSLHTKSGCKLTAQGQLVHRGKCPQPEDDGNAMTQLFRLGMLILHPAIRHAAKSFFNMDITDPSVDYLAICKKSTADFWKPKKGGNKPPKT